MRDLTASDILTVLLLSSLYFAAIILPDYMPYLSGHKVMKGCAEHPTLNTS